MITVWARKGDITKGKERRNIKAEGVTEDEIRRETKEVKSILHHVKENPESIRKGIELIADIVPKIKASFNSLERSRRAAEGKEAKLAQEFADYEQFIATELVNCFDDKFAVDIFEMLTEGAKEANKDMRIEIKNDKRLYRGKKPARHILKKHFMNAKRLTKEENRIRSETKSIDERKTELAEEIKTLADKLPRTHDDLQKAVLELVNVLNEEFTQVFKVEWDVDEEEAILVETSKFHLAALNEFQELSKDPKIQELGSILGGVVNEYSQRYIAQDINHGKKVKKYMEHNQEVCAEGLKKSKKKKNAFRYLRILLLPTGLAPFLFICNKKYRHWALESAPKLIPVLTRAAFSGGKTLLEPADLDIMLNVGLKCPDLTKKEKENIKDFLNSPKGKKAVEIASKELGKRIDANIN